MSNIDWTRATKYFLLMDFIKGFGLGMKYFFAPKSVAMGRGWEFGPRFSAKVQVLGGFSARWAVGG